MEKIKDYIVRNFEQNFVIGVLVSVAFINYFIPYKLAFLNFYFIPVLLAASYLDTRRAMLGAVLCTILVGAYFGAEPQSFQCGSTTLDLALNLTAWACFLLLCAAVIGRLQERLRAEVRQGRELLGKLNHNNAELEAAGRKLKEFTVDLESKVVERTAMLEKSKKTVESLKNKVEETLFSTMDPEVAKLIIEERLRNEKRKISVMFCDLKGFTRYSEVHQPEVVIGDLNAFLGEMEAVVMAYRGHIDKYTGDGLMVEYGAPVDYERHALLAVVAGLKMQERTERARFPWKMRLGIATGDPIIGLVGKKRQMYTAIGDTVNIASRIEEVSTPGKVTIDEGTYNEVRSFVDARKKALLPVGEFGGAADLKELGACLAELERRPTDAGELKKAADLLMRGNDVLNAHEYFKRALEAAPNDEKIKLAFAEASLKVERMGNIAVRGRQRILRLYEVEGLKDPLRDESKTPSRVWRDYGARLSACVEYPEDAILPVECLDGSVGVSRLVGLFSYAMADMLNMTDKEKKDVVLAAYLADVGKCVVPHHLLNRAGSLERVEFDEVKKHCREGVERLRKMGYASENMLDIVAAHHEYFNGSGYPAGISGDKIPLGARVVAVAEEYASYVSWRPYRDLWDRKAAFFQIEKDARKGKFDPKVVRALSNLLELDNVPTIVL